MTFGKQNNRSSIVLLKAMKKIIFVCAENAGVPKWPESASERGIALEPTLAVHLYNPFLNEVAFADIVSAHFTELGNNLKSYHFTFWPNNRSE